MLKRRRTEQDNMLDASPFVPVRPRRAPSPEAKQRRRRRRVSFVRQLGVAAAIVMALYLMVPILLRASRMRPIVEDRLTHELGRRVRIGSLHYSPMFGSIIADDVSVADDPLFSPAPFLHANRLELSVNRLALIFRRAVEINGVAIDEATITLIKSAGQWNYSAFLANPAPAGETAVAVRISRAILAIRDGGEEPFVVRNLNFEAAQFSTGRDSAFSLIAQVEGGGSIKVDGRAGPVRWAGGSPLLPVNVLVSARKVALAESNLTSSLAPGVDGQLSFDGSIESDDARVTIAGNVEIAKLRLAENGEPATDPLRFVIAIDHNRASNIGTLSRCDAMVPKGAASITGTYTLSSPPGVSFRVTAQGIPVTPVGGLGESAGVPLPPGASFQGGLAFLDLTVDGPVKGPVTKGSIALQNTKLMAFDLEDRLSAVTGLDALHISRDLPIDEMRGKVEMTPEKVKLSDWQIDLPEVGIFAGGGEIDASRTLDLQMSAIRKGVTEKLPIPFLVRGACVSPVFRQAGKI
jgi:AsmA protein